jgi:hypothetical protein
MDKKELDEAMTVMDGALDDLLATLSGSTGTTGAQTRYVCGWLAGNGRALLGAGGLDFWIAFTLCFEMAQRSGASFENMDKVRANAEARAVTRPPAIALRNFTVRMALAEQARILAATDFKSRQDVDRYFDRINAAFETAELVAANNLDNVAYRLLIAIHAAVSNDLANRSRPLPRMVKVTFPSSLPSLYVSQRLYADAARTSELIDENKPIHPLFMPTALVALSQ